MTCRRATRRRLLIGRRACRVTGVVESPMRNPVFETKRSRGLRHLIELAMVEYAIEVSHRLNAKRNRKMAIYAHDLIGISINQFGVYEKEELDVLFDFLTPLKETFAAGTCLDVGANI